MPKTWILISDASRARLFAITGKGRPWTLVQELNHPESRLKGLDLVSDTPGRIPQSKGVRSRPGMAPTTEPKEVEAEHFADQLATVLEDGHGRNAYARLVLVAPPHFLGLLRKGVSVQVGKLITTTIGKDFTQLKEHELPARLADIV